MVSFPSSWTCLALWGKVEWRRVTDGKGQKTILLGAGHCLWHRRHKIKLEAKKVYGTRGNTSWTLESYSSFTTLKAGFPRILTYVCFSFCSTFPLWKFASIPKALSLLCPVNSLITSSAPITPPRCTFLFPAAHWTPSLAWVSSVPHYTKNFLRWRKCYLYWPI